MTANINVEPATIAGTSLAVSRVGLGTWAIGGWMWGGTDEEESVKTIHAAVERGINLIDTAPAYGFGHSEEIVGRAIDDRRLRSHVVIATKAGSSGRMGRSSGMPAETGSCARRPTRYGGCAPITSISISCIGPTRSYRSKRRPKRCRRSWSKTRSGPLA